MHNQTTKVPVLSKISRLIRTNTDVVVCAFVYVAAVLASFPVSVILGKSPPRFTLWFDQGKYLAASSAFLHFNLDQHRHWYPFLYSLCLAPFAWLPTLTAVLVPDCLFFLMAFVGFRSVFSEFAISRRACVVLFLFATVAYPVTGDSWIQPWTTTLSAGLVWTALALAIRIVKTTDAELDHAGARCIGLGVVLGLLPLCRPADAIMAVPIVLPVLAKLARHRLGWSMLARMILAGTAVIGIGGCVYLGIYGPHPSGYLKLSAVYGANFAWFGWKAYLILIDPRPWYPYGYGVLKIMPWLLLGLAGITVQIFSRKNRMITAILLATASVYSVMMISYVDFLPSGLWKFGNFHYFKWLIPMFAAFAWIFVRDFAHRPVASTIALVVAGLPAMLHIDAMPAARDEPARLVLFPAVRASFDDVYFARSGLTDRQGTQRAVYDFHPVPGDGGSVYAEPLRRDFAGDERWIFPADRLSWPDNGAPVRRIVLPGPFPMQPQARYKATVGFGWPCWLPPYACPTDLP